MIPILALVLATPSWQSDGEAIRDDLVLARAVEEFVIDARPDRGPPEPYRGLIDRLGAPVWRDREEASEAMRAASVGDPRWLFWGRRHSDPEVRLRSNAILRRLYPCQACKGYGRSRNWDSWACWDCQGTATAWPWSIWD